MRVVARARREFQTDAVGLAFVSAVESGRNQGFVTCVGNPGTTLAKPEQGGTDADRGARRHCLRYLFAGMFAQGVRDFVAQYDCDLVIGQMQLIDQPGIDHHLAAGHAERVELVAGNQVDLPFPARCITAENLGLRLEPAGNCAHPRQHGLVLIERALA